MGVVSLCGRITRSQTMSRTSRLAALASQSVPTQILSECVPVGLIVKSHKYQSGSVALPIAMCTIWKRLILAVLSLSDR